MSETPAPRSELWRQRLRRFRAGLRRSAPFASGVLAALVALLLYNALVPAPHQVTTREVKDTVAQAMASATPPPAHSERVYQIIRPSLALIQTHTRDAGGEDEHGLGSGVVINDRGNVLTALHVVTNAAGITVTFADGTHSSAQIVAQYPENDTALLEASQLPVQVVPATIGSPQAMQVGETRC